MEWLLVVLLGIAGSSLGSLIGLGGGIIIVPALLYIGTLGGLPPIAHEVAVGTSMFTMIFTGLSSTIGYIKHKTIDYKSGLIFLIGITPGAVVGAWMVKSLDFNAFNTYFGLFILLVSAIMVLRNRIKPIPYRKEKGLTRTFTDITKNTYEYGYNPIIAVLIALVVGFLSGLFGVGGGALMVPAMIILFFFPPHVAVATSMFMIFVTSLISSVTHFALGNIDWQYSIALVPGAWIGAQLGVFLNSKLQSKSIILILRIILVIVAARLIYEGFAG